MSVPVLSRLFDARGRPPRGPFPVRPPAGTRRPALAAEAARAIRRQPTGSGPGPPSPTLRANPYPEVTDPFCRLFFKQKTAYEMVSCDWSSDVCSSDLLSVPVLSRLFDARGRPPKKPFPVRPPAGTRWPALAAGAARAVRRQPTGSGPGPPSPTLRANPFPEVTDPFCRLPLPTLFHWPEAVHLGDLMRL